MEKLRLLVLSVGTQVGQNILTTLSRRRHDLALIATSSVTHEPSVFDWDAVYLVPVTAAEPEAFELRLLDIMDSERIDLVIPCRDDDVVFLSALRERRPDLAPRLLCGSAEPGAIIADKWKSAQFSTRHALPFAPSIASATAGERAEFARRNGFPLVAKPRRGYASQDVYLISNDAQFERTLAQDGWIVQKYLGDPRGVADFLEGIEARGIPLYYTLQGLKTSIQALIAPDGRVLHVICTRNRLRMRRSKRVEKEDDPVAADIGVRCAHAFAGEGWRGPLNIQCQRDADGVLLIHEFNGRFTGATVDRWLLGFDEVGASIAAFTGVRFGDEAEAPPASLEVFESLRARGADPRNVEAFARDRVWRRAT